MADVHKYEPDAHVLILRYGLVLRFGLVLSMLLSVTLAEACIPQAQAQSPGVFDQREQTFVAGLLQRRLFDVAEAHCLELLDRKQIQVADQTALTVQLIQTRTSMALVAGAEDVWQSVWQTEEDFEKRFPRHPGKMQVSIQTALAHLQRAQRMGSIIEAQMVSPPEVSSVTESMLEQCRDAKRIFTTIERDIDRLLPERRSRTIADGELNPQQLLALKSSVRYQIALCQLQIASAYQQSDSVAWGSALNDVLKRLQEVQDSVIPSQQIWWQSKVSRLECLLMLGKTDEVERQLSTLPEEPPPASILQRLIEQRLKLAMATGDKATLKTHLLVDQAQSRAEGLASSPQLELVRIQAAVVLSKLLDDSQQQKFWLDAASQKKQMVQLRYGSWWGRRAGLALVRAAGRANVAAVGPSGTFGQNNGNATHAAAVELLVQTAIEAQRDGDLDDALKAYDQAIEQLSAPEAILRLQIPASQILEQQSQPSEAAKRLTAAASAAANQPVAAATHLRGVWNLARAVATTNPPGISSLVGTLNEHLSQWPESPTKNTAALWLMAEHIRSNDAQKALVAFDTIDSQSDSFPEALTQIRALFFQVSKRSKGQKQASKKLAGDIVARLHVRYEGMAESGDRYRAASILGAMTEVALESDVKSVDQLDRLVASFQQRFTGEAVASAEEKELLGWSGLLMILNSSSPNQSDVDKAKMLLVNSSPNEALCRRLFRVMSKHESELARGEAGDDQSFSQRKALQLFGLEIIGIVNRLPLSVRGSDRWKFQWGSLLRKNRQPQEAVSLLEPLAQRFRGDLLIQLEFARALSEAQIDQRQEDTLKTWRRLAKSLTPATDNWYEAKLNVARQLELSGDREAAKKLLLFTRSVYRWESSIWSDELDRLLRSLRTVASP